MNSFLYDLDPKTSVATITLNRPERLNALTFEVYTEMRDTFQKLDTEPGVRWYLTVRPAEDLPTSSGAAHNRQENRRPAAPSRRNH